MITIKEEKLLIKIRKSRLYKKQYKQLEKEIMLIRKVIFKCKNISVYPIVAGGRSNLNPITKKLPKTYDLCSKSLEHIHEYIDSKVLEIIQQLEPVTI